MPLLDAQPVVLVTGIPASGKSTVSDLLAHRFERGVHVKGDVFRRMVVSGRQEMSLTPTEEAWRQLRLRYQLGAKTADGYHKAGFSVVIQDVIIGHVLSDYVRWINSRPLVVVVLTPSTDIVVLREAQRAKVAYKDAQTIMNLDATLRNATPRIGMWIDNSEQLPSETVDLIVGQAFELGRVS